MDQYDEFHACKYYQNINFYDDSDISTLLESYIEKDFINVPIIDEWDITKECKIDEARSSFVTTIQRLKNCLDILDYRTITSISGRISSYQSYLKSDGKKQVWNIITVYRCISPSTPSLDVNNKIEPIEPIEPVDGLLNPRSRNAIVK